MYPTEKEVLSSMIAKMRAFVIRDLMSEKDLEKKQELEEKQKLLGFEEIAVLRDDEVAKSIQDKANRLYSPLLKAYYAKK